jgi:hypothetical protein
MPDAKYGRLFTEADVRKLAARWLGNRAMGPDIMVETLDDLERTGELTFPADEPLFLLRGSDGLWAPFSTSDGSDDPVRCSLEQALSAWQAANPDRVKAPD